MKTVDFREQIQTLLDKKEISISKLSHLTNLNANTIYTYMRGESEITSANLTKILNSLNAL